MKSGESTLGWSQLQEVQKSPLPGHFPIHFDILVWKMQKKLKKNCRLYPPQEQSLFTTTAM